MYAEPRSPSETPAEASAWLDEPVIRRALSYLNFGLAQAEGFIVLTGPTGPATATLLDRLLPTGERSRLIRHSAEQVLADTATLVLARAMGFSARIDDANLLDELEARLEADLRAGKRNLLIVDDAQFLSNAALEELVCLANLRAGGRALIQILLLGSSGLARRLGEPCLEPLRKRIIASHTLGSAADADGPEESRVLPLRSGRRAAMSEPASLESRLEDRIAAVEARIEEQECALRRIITLLLDGTYRNPGMHGAP